MKHPGPWSTVVHGPDVTVYDANGRMVGEIGDGDKRDEELERLILAAPELLAALKRVGSCCGCLDKEASALIARIEKGTP